MNRNGETGLHPIRHFSFTMRKIAEQHDCEMFIAGCEMVMSEHREAEWRKLLSDIRQVYHGLLSYNTDKYQEHRVNWWDAVDVISSSGYYPYGDWENQLDRIETVVNRFQKPFFLCGNRMYVGKKVPKRCQMTGV